MRAHGAHPQGRRGTGAGEAGHALDERIAEGVIAKHRSIFALVRGSAHATELFTYTHSMAGEIFAELDTHILQMLSVALGEDPALAPGANQLARALYFGSAEIANRSKTGAEMELELHAFAVTHLAGVRAIAKQKAGVSGAA